MYNVPLAPYGVKYTSLLHSNGVPNYFFGITSTGMEMDPFPILWWKNGKLGADPSKWICEPLACKGFLGIDCNDAHPDGNGIYHYHGVPQPFKDATSGKKMTLVGYAADGFPIYYKYGYKEINHIQKALVELKSSWQLKKGCRKKDPAYAGEADIPCGNYNGKFTLDYQFVPGSGDLDSSNGRLGWTPEFGETYYYVITDAFPIIPRYFRGVPSDDFKVK
jgi:hypothetical protein